MIVPSEGLAKFEAQYAAEAFADWTYLDALAWFAAAWSHARALNPEFGNDWREDLEADCALARVLNAIPEAT